MDWMAEVEMRLKRGNQLLCAKDNTFLETSGRRVFDSYRSDKSL